MKSLITFTLAFIVSLFCLMAHAATPSFSSFAQDQFQTNGYQVRIKGVGLTNVLQPYVKLTHGTNTTYFDVLTNALPSAVSGDTITLQYGVTNWFTASTNVWPDGITISGDPTQPRAIIYSTNTNFQVSSNDTFRHLSFIMNGLTNDPPSHFPTVYWGLPVINGAARNFNFNDCEFRGLTHCIAWGLQSSSLPSGTNNVRGVFESCILSSSYKTFDNDNDTNDSVMFFNCICRNETNNAVYYGTQPFHGPYPVYGDFTWIGGGIIITNCAASSTPISFHVVNSSIGPNNTNHLTIITPSFLTYYGNTLPPADVSVDQKLSHSLVLGGAVVKWSAPTLAANAMRVFPTILNFTPTNNWAATAPISGISLWNGTNYYISTNLFIGGTNATPPVNAVTPVGWELHTDASGNSYKVPTYQ